MNPRDDLTLQERLHAKYPRLVEESIEHDARLAQTSGRDGAGRFATRPRCSFCRGNLIPEHNASPLPDDPLLVCLACGRQHGYTAVVATEPPKNRQQLGLQRRRVRIMEEDE